MPDSRSRPPVRREHATSSGGRARIPTVSESTPNRRRPRTAVGAVRAALAEARDARRMTVEHEVTAVLALKVAALVDRAAGDVDSPAADSRLLKATEQLRDLLDVLPLRPVAARGEGAGSDSGDGRATVLELLSGPPTMGDAAHT